VSRHFDAIIIGTGQAGPALAARLAAAGMAVAIIERHKFGGTCVNTGCIPTKTLVASAYAAHVARRGAEYGFDVTGDVRVDMKRVKARKDDVSGRSNRGVEEWLRGLNNCTVIQGHARFQSSHTVVVNDEVLQADKLFINVGGRSSVPAMPGFQDVPFLTNSSMMDVDFLPEHLVIVGGSYIGLEFGQMYRRFGSHVTIVEMGPRLIGREDEDISEAVRDILEAEGIQIRLNATCISLAKRNNGVAVRMGCDEGPPEVVGTHVLLAVGRIPNTNDLGLDRAGVATDPRGYIVVDEQLQTNVPGIWAATAVPWVTTVPRIEETWSATEVFSTGQLSGSPTAFWPSGSSTGFSLPSSRWSISLMPAGPGTGGWSLDRSTAPGLIVV